VATVEPEPDLLAPTPCTGHLIGYARTSRRNQNLDRQINALTTAGCKRIYQDQLSGKDAARPGLTKALDHLLEGDTLVVTELSRLGRSLQDLITIVADLRRRNVGFRSLHEQLDTTTPGGRLVFHVFAALAEFVRELIVEGTSEGLDAARARGQRLGRPPVMTPDKIRMASELVGKESVAAIARLLGVNRATLYAHIPALQDRRRTALPLPGAIGTTSPASEA
jgi:DNA invertase Pin-like site-specific DNA recombinase